MISIVDIKDDAKEIRKLRAKINKALKGVEALSKLNEYKELTAKIGIAIQRPIGIEIKSFDKIIDDLTKSKKIVDDRLEELKNEKQ